MCTEHLWEPHALVALPCVDVNDIGFNTTPLPSVQVSPLLHTIAHPHPNRYDPDHICNGSDDSGRYDYIHQPAICHWNCERLAEALAPLLAPARARAGLGAFDAAFAE
jgi:hypothetical protein